MGTRIITNDAVYVLKLDLLGKGKTARVFSAYLVAKSPAKIEWAVKLAKDHEHNIYIEREYETLNKLSQALEALPKTARAINAHSPFPEVQLGEVADGRKALVMKPILRQPLQNIIATLSDPLEREILATSAARQYVDLLQAQSKAKVSCLERRLEDLWWVGSPKSGYLVVTGWNVVTEAPSQSMDLYHFGELWFELSAGWQIAQDYQPSRQDFNQVKNKISYGLWYVIGRSLGSGIGPQIFLSELSGLLDELLDYYHQHPKTLVQRASMNLKQAQMYLDRTQADLAWVQFDIAQRRGARGLSLGLEQARLWAYNPVKQAAPDLIKLLASPDFAHALIQLQDLKQKAQKPQEVGNIARLQLVFEVLTEVKAALVKVKDNSNQTSPKFIRFQNLLVEGVTRPLVEKNGIAASKYLQELYYLQFTEQNPNIQAKLEGLGHEASFWIAYQEIHHNLHHYPDLAKESLAQVITLRQTISYWPDLYQPTVADLERLQSTIEANLQASLLNQEIEAVNNNSFETSRAGITISQRSPIDISRFWLSLGEDLIKNKWVEALSELLAKLNLEPENEGFNMAIEEIIQRLEHRHNELTDCRPGPAILVEQIKILETLLNMPADFAPDPVAAQQMQQELEERHNLATQIAQDQQALFQHPDRILTQAINNGYELFDDVGLSVTVLKTVHEAGHWDGNKLTQKTDNLEEQAKRFITITNLLDSRKELLEQALSFYTPLAEDPPPADISSFYANTLRLYLTTAQKQIQSGDDPTVSLSRASHILKQADQFLIADDQTSYQHLYEHLLELSHLV